jgi:sulfur carrier protein
LPEWENVDMDILLNGAMTSIPDHCTVAQLLEHNGLAARRIATEVNGMIVPRSEQASRVLDPGDRVELVHALGGG